MLHYPIRGSLNSAPTFSAVSLPQDNIHQTIAGRKRFYKHVTVEPVAQGSAEVSKRLARDKGDINYVFWPSIKFYSMERLLKHPVDIICM